MIQLSHGVLLGLLAEVGVVATSGGSIGGELRDDASDEVLEGSGRHCRKLDGTTYGATSGDAP